jgi:hypothetical protein
MFHPTSHLARPLKGHVEAKPGPCRGLVAPDRPPVQGGVDAEKARTGTMKYPTWNLTVAIPVHGVASLPYFGGAIRLCPMLLNNLYVGGRPVQAAAGGRENDMLQMQTAGNYTESMRQQNRQPQAPTDPPNCRSQPSPTPAPCQCHHLPHWLPLLPAGPVAPVSFVS